MATPLRQPVGGQAVSTAVAVPQLDSQALPLSKSQIQEVVANCVLQSLRNAGVLPTPDPLLDDTIYSESDDEGNGAVGDTVGGPDGTTRRRSKGTRLKLGPIKLNFTGEEGPHTLITFLDAFKEAVRMRKMTPKQKAQQLRVCVTGDAYKQVIQPMDLYAKHSNHTAPQMIAALKKHYISEVTVSVNRSYLHDVHQGTMSEMQYAQSLMKAALIAIPERPGLDVAALREEAVCAAFLKGINNAEGRLFLWHGAHKTIGSMVTTLDMYHMLKREKHVLIQNHPHEKEFARAVMDYIGPDDADPQCNVAPPARNPKNYWRPPVAKGDWLSPDNSASYLDNLKAWVTKVQRLLDGAYQADNAKAKKGKGRGKGGPKLKALPPSSSKQDDPPKQEGSSSCKGLCYRCSKRGHFMRDCPEPRKGAKPSVCAVGAEEYCPGTYSAHACKCKSHHVHWTRDAPTSATEIEEIDVEEEYSDGEDSRDGTGA